MASARELLDREFDLGALRVYNPRVPVDPTDLVRLQDLTDAIAAATFPSGSVPSAGAKYWVSTHDASLTSEVNLGLLSTGLVKITVAGGPPVATPSIAVANADFPATSAFYVVTQAGSGGTAAPPNAVNLGALAAGAAAFLKVAISGGIATLTKDTSAYLTQAYATVKDGAGAAVTQRSTLKFTGGTVTVTDVSGETVVNIPTTTGITQAYTTVQLNGSNLTQRFTLNVLPRLVAADVSSPASTTLDLASGIATPGTYTSVTVDTYGRVTAGTSPTIYYQTIKDGSGSAQTQRNTLKFTSRFSVSDVSSETVAELADTVGTGGAGAFTNANVTVDRYGRVTAVANGTSGAYNGTVAGAIPYTNTTPFALTEDDNHLRYENGAFGGTGTMSRVYIGVTGSLTNSINHGSTLHLYTEDQSLPSIIRIQGSTAEIHGWQGTKGGTEIPIGAIQFGDGSNGTTSGALHMLARKSTTGGGGVVEMARFEAGGITMNGAIYVGSSGIDEGENIKAYMQFQAHGTAPAIAPSNCSRIRHATGTDRLELSNRSTNSGTYSPIATLADLAGGTGPTGSAGGDLAGTYPNPTVAAIHETSGPTQLTIGSVADGAILRRSGSTLIGLSAPTGDLGGTWAATTVAKITTTTGPTSLTIGAIGDGELLIRSGSTVVSTSVLSVGRRQISFGYYSEFDEEDATNVWLVSSDRLMLSATAIEFGLPAFTPLTAWIRVNVISNTSVGSAVTFKLTRNGTPIGSGVTYTSGVTGQQQESIGSGFSSTDTLGVWVSCTDEVPDGTIKCTVAIRASE